MSDPAKEVISEERDVKLSDSVVASIDGGKASTGIEVITDKNGLKKHVCVHCQREFRTKAQCQRHIGASHSAEPFHRNQQNDDDGEGIRKHHQCSVCDVRYALLSHLRFHWGAKHRKEHGPLQVEGGKGGEKGRFQCNHCGEFLGSKYTLAAHEKTHQIGNEEEKKVVHQCKVCLAKFKSLNVLSKHLNKHAGAVENAKKSLPCEVCEAVFTSREGRRVHMILKHNAGTTYNCDQCPMIFARRGNLRLHMTTHGVRPHVCSVCGLSFARIDSLQKHELACSEGKRGMSCEVCGQKFRKEELLQKHRQQGHPFMDHRCEHCGLGFESKRALSHHVRVHQGTFQCEFCPLKFVTDKALGNHKNVRHWEQMGIERVIGKQGRRKDAPPRPTEPKARVRRNKYNPFLGLEHLVEPAEPTVVKEEEEVVDGKGKESNEDVKSNHDTEDSEDDNLASLKLKLTSVNFDNSESLRNNDSIKPDEDIKPDDTALPIILSQTLMKTLHFFDENLESVITLEKTEIDRSISISDPEVEVKAENDHSKTYDHVEDSDHDDDPDFKIEDSNSVDDNDDDNHQDQDNADSESTKSDPPAPKPKRKYRPKRREPRENVKSSAVKNPFPRKFSCEDCGKSFAHHSWWALHRSKEHGVQEKPAQPTKQRIHFCDQCSKNFSDWRNLLYHLRHVHYQEIKEEDLARCKSCKKKFVSEKDLQQHNCIKGTYLNRKPQFKCDLCDKMYISQHGLDCHRSVHPEYHKFCCDVCGKPYADEKSMNYHKKRVHVDASYVCEVCDKSFKVLAQLKTHALIHQQLKNYQCEFCGKSFAQRNGMTAHMRVAHAEQLGQQALAEREISCPVCDKKLKGKPCLKLHMKTHNNDRKFQCSHCDRKFVTKQDQYRHEQTHTKEYKFKCRFCNKGSTRKKLILLHEAREHNEMHNVGFAHKCVTCWKSFSSPSALAIHESLHSEDLPVGCVLCDRKFKNEKYMKYHLKAHHRASGKEEVKQLVKVERNEPVEVKAGELEMKFIESSDAISGPEYTEVPQQQVS